MPCNGCGGKGHTPGDSYGHVLGCGASKFNDVDRYSPFTKIQTNNILHRAMVDALGKARNANVKSDEPAFAPFLAESIGLLLETECKE